MVDSRVPPGKGGMAIMANNILNNQILPNFNYETKTKFENGTLTVSNVSHVEFYTDNQKPNTLTIDHYRYAGLYKQDKYENVTELRVIANKLCNLIDLKTLPKTIKKITIETKGNLSTHKSMFGDEIKISKQVIERMGKGQLKIINNKRENIFGVKAADRVTITGAKKGGLTIDTKGEFRVINHFFNNKNNQEIPDPSFSKKLEDLSILTIKANTRSVDYSNGKPEITKE